MNEPLKQVHDAMASLVSQYEDKIAELKANWGDHARSLNGHIYRIANQRDDALSKLAEKDKEIAAMREVVEAAKILDHDIASDNDGCYDVGHLKSMRDALANLEGKP